MPSVSISLTINLPARLFAPLQGEVSAVFGEVFKRRGYIVIVTRPGPSYELGQKIDNIWGYKTRRKFVVTEFTNRQDCERQLSLISKLRRGWMRTRQEFPAGVTFYRVMPWSREIAKKLKGGKPCLTS